MKKIGFDQAKYFKMQSEKINERIKHFGGKLYLEFGGKLFDDYHASRVLPGFEPDSKVKMLLSMKDSAEIDVMPKAEDHPDIEQFIVECPEKDKLKNVVQIMAKEDLRKTIVFCNTKAQTSKVGQMLATAGVSTRVLHGDISQSQRNKVMDLYRADKFDVLVATDVVARGIDVDDIEDLEMFKNPIKVSYSGKHYKDFSELTLTFTSGKKDMYGADIIFDKANQMVYFGLPQFGKEYAAMAGSGTSGAYYRGVQTETGGYWEKLFVSAYQHIKLDPHGSDCGTNRTIEVLLTEDNINKILRDLKLQDLDDIYLSVGSTRYTAGYIVNLATEEKDSVQDALIEKIRNNSLNKKESSYSSDIIIDGLDDIEVNLAKCCKPILGEPIIGYITKGQGISIHRIDCKNVVDKTERLIQASWNEKTNRVYKTDLLIEVDNIGNYLLDIIFYFTKLQYTLLMLLKCFNMI